ncbi:MULTISPECIES: pirin family protein [unclassified Streptomyces]|uniref:pirin family protein n=1 Tax=unclassified Streptomyces TaxID=2593676 RepID=UPI002E0D519C|nr:MULTISPECIES: pirin family protein [unclassified Streptomyces]WSQ83298.1 pirin family protein [Streptomyces sp. NBC_01212]WSR10671.1 pirin family protein [Streptomyces sp. NBC_01208]
MSNAETDAPALRCGELVEDDRPAGAPGIDVLSAREVPLGGPRAMRVRRTLPQRKRTLIGAWCFADHYGPHDVAVSGGMDMPPHPHTGLQTVSWLFSGEIEHRDTLGTHALIRPGEMNLMTGGHGIAHSEVSTPGTAVLHGVQLWVALPEEHRHTAPDFQHYVPEPAQVDGAEIRVFLGSLVGRASPARAFTPLLGAEIVIGPRATLTLAVDTTFEHGLLVDSGDVRIVDTVLRPAELGYVPRGAGTLTMVNETDAPARAVLLGGPPFGEEIVMWWNFVARSTEEIVQARQDWTEGRRFGEVTGYEGAPLPAPEMPNVPLKPRRNSPLAPR